MSDLFTKIIDIEKKIDLQTKAIHDLTILVMKGNINDTWINEDVAASMLNYSPRSLRIKVKDGHKLCQKPWNIIDYRHSNGRNYQYSRKSIIEFQKNTSS